MTATSGSDVQATYMVRDTVTGKVVRTKSTQLSGDSSAAWSHAGAKVAFWGIPGSDTDLFVYDTALKSLAHGALTSGDAVNVTGIAWAPDDSLLAYTVNSWQGADRGHL